MSENLRERTACFTGPRPASLYGYGEVYRRAYSDIVAHTARVVANLNGEGYDRFISGGAQGFDQLAFWSVEKVKKGNPSIRNMLYIPFDGQERLWGVSGVFGQREYQKMKSMADAFIYTTEGKVSGRYETIKALHNRNYRMVDDSSLVIALLAGKSLDWRHSCGGTSGCIRYAMSTGKKVLAITLAGSSYYL